MAKPTIKSLRAELTTKTQVTTDFGKVVVIVKSNVDDSIKTIGMKRVERRLNLPIENIISKEKNGSRVARELGVGRSTVALWRRKLGISIRPDWRFTPRGERKTTNKRVREVRRIYSSDSAIRKGEVYRLVRYCPRCA